MDINFMDEMSNKLLEMHVKDIEDKINLALTKLGVDLNETNYKRITKVLHAQEYGVERYYLDFTTNPILLVLVYPNHYPNFGYSIELMIK